mgnify:CR=1 FL=1
MSLNLDRSAWKRVLLGDVAMASKERVDPTSGDVDRYVAGEHMDTDSLKIHRWGEVGDGYLGPAFHRHFHPGQVLYGSRRTYLRKVAVAEFDGVTANTTFVVETRGTSVLLQEFLPFVMTAEPFHAFAIRESKGSVNPYVNWSDIARYEFDLPPIDEQKRLADLLWAVENERRTVQLLLAATLDLREGTIESRFVGAGDNILQDLTGKDGIRIGPFGAQLHAYDYIDDGECPVVMPQDMIGGRVSTASIQRISDARADELAVHRLRPGDIVLPRRGELDRRALITELEDGWLCGTGSVRVRVRSDVSSAAVFLALSSRTTVEWLKANATGTTMPNLNAAIVARIPISLPSGKALDKALEEVALLEAAATTARRRAEQTTQVKTALLTSIFEGEA